MHRLSATTVLPVPIGRAWWILADLHHFGGDDPFHHGLECGGEFTARLHKTFTVLHSYIPLLPLPGEVAECIVSRHEAPYVLEIRELTRRCFTAHTHRFVLRSRWSRVTEVEYAIVFRRIPWFLYPLRLWIEYLVRRQLRRRLNALGARCRRAS